MHACSRNEDIQTQVVVYQLFNLCFCSWLQAEHTAEAPSKRRKTRHFGEDATGGGGQPDHASDAGSVSDAGSRAPRTMATDKQMVEEALKEDGRHA